MKNKTKILHVDGDNFFVSCELARFPHLKGKPVIVGEERGIASAMSYEAKRLGVQRGMPVFEIRKQFPQVVILPAHFELYEQYALKLYQVLCKYSDTVERYSIDECFALIDESELNLLETIKQEAESCLGITLSFGLADTKTLAKIGSKYNKPSGCITITEQERIRFLKETSVGSVWGIGRAISARLTSYNIKTAYDFILLDPIFVKKSFGEGTLATWHELRGERYLEVHGYGESSYIPKSLQSTRSFGKSFNIYSRRIADGSLQTPRERSFFLSELSNHAESLCARLRFYKLKTNRLSFFLKKNTLSDRYISREVEIGFYTDNASDLCKAINTACEEIFDALDAQLDTQLQAHDAKYNGSDPSLYTDLYTSCNNPNNVQNPTQDFGFKIKATGISIYQLKPVEAIQDDLFATQSTLDTKRQYTEVIDSLISRVGANSIYLCSSLESKKRRNQIFNQRNLKNKFIYGLPLPYMGEVS